VTVRRVSAATVAVLVLFGLVLSGCVSTGRGVGTGSIDVGAVVTVGATASVGATETIETTGTADAVEEPDSSDTADPKASTSGKTEDVTGADLAAIEKQLEAMQRELDSLSMPSDNDFSGAEDAVY
jgi:predicted small secreted protein